MRFVIEIPDELFRMGGGPGQAEATVSPLVASAPGAVISGGPAPAIGGGVVRADGGDASDAALSAGPSLRYGGVSVASPTPSAPIDGGTAPPSA